MVSHDEITGYQSIVGTLLYLTKFSRPDLANSVRELTKVMDGLTKCDIKMMLRVVKYIKDTRNLGLKMVRPNDEIWSFNVFPTRTGQVMHRRERVFQVGRCLLMKIW